MTFTLKCPRSHENCFERFMTFGVFLTFGKKYKKEMDHTFQGDPSLIILFRFNLRLNQAKSNRMSIGSCSVANVARASESILSANTVAIKITGAAISGIVVCGMISTGFAGSVISVTEIVKVPITVVNIAVKTIAEISCKIL